MAPSSAMQPDSPVYFCPRLISRGSEAASLIDAGKAAPLAGGPLAFSAIEILARAKTVCIFDLADFHSWRRGLKGSAAERAGEIYARLTRSRGETFAARRGPQVMGIVNVTPDSFSDGGRFLDADKAVAHGRMLAGQGAEILDIGGESTRPGATPVAAENEIARVLPVIEGLKGLGVTLSIDTRHAAAMGAAIGAGADLINDVTALTGDPASLSAAARLGAPIVLMHMQGEPRTMQGAPRYDDVRLDVYDYLENRIAACEKAGIPRSRLILDPGIGFGKTLAHNLALLNSLTLFHGLGAPLLLGASRKSFIAKLDDDAPASERLGGSLAAALLAADAGVQILRVHDVAATAQALKVWKAVAFP